MIRAVVLVLFGAMSLPIFAIGATKQKIFRAKDTFLRYKSEHIELVRIEGKDALRLERVGDTPHHSDDLVFDFEHESLLRNPADRNLVLESNLDRKREPDFSTQAAYFAKNGAGIKLHLPPRLNLSGQTLTREAGDFSFAAEIAPKATDAEILRRENFDSGTHYLFRIAIRKSRIVVELLNLIERKGASGQILTESVSLTSLDKLSDRETVHKLLITYNEALGLFQLIVDQKPQGDARIIKSVDRHSILSFAPLASAPTRLFALYRGRADNVVFANRIMTADDFAHFGKVTTYGDRYDSRKAFALSEVFDMRFSESSIVSAKLDAKATTENFIALKGRCSNKRFLPELLERDLPFKKKADLVSAKCRFLQFKIDMAANNNGTESPLLHALVFEYTENPPPERPLAPRIIEAKNEAITIELQPNVEIDVHKGGRYIIHYGHKPHEPQGAIYVGENMKPFTHKTSLRIKFDNTILAANKSWADKNPNFKNRYPVFETGLGYYFWVTACDNAWGEAQELRDHESLPSEAVFARFE